MNTSRESGDDAAIVDAFVAHLAVHRYPGIHVESRPDVENRNSSDIDAIAGPLAIEHTSVDTIEHQRRNSAWFGEVALPLESRFRDVLGFRLRLIFPYDGIAVGHDWNAVRAALDDWLSTTARDLPNGRHSVKIPGVPFDFQITKESDRPPGLFCMRVAPDDTTLASRLERQMKRKAQKLKPYGAEGKTTLLLLDSGDIALMNVHKLLDAVRATFPGGLPEGVDELWYADTSVPSVLEFWDLGRMIGRT